MNSMYCGSSMCRNGCTSMMNFNEPCAHYPQEMKTPLQELLERVQHYRDAETSPLVVSRLNSVCVDILGMLEKEKDVIIEFADICVDVTNDQSYRNRIKVIIDQYNETINS